MIFVSTPYARSSKTSSPSRHSHFLKLPPSLLSFLAGSTIRPLVIMAVCVYPSPTHDHTQQSTAFIYMSLNVRCSMSLHWMQHSARCFSVLHIDIFNSGTIIVFLAFHSTDKPWFTFSCDIHWGFWVRFVVSSSTETLLSTHKSSEDEC